MSARNSESLVFFYENAFSDYLCSMSVFSELQIVDAVESLVSSLRFS